MIEAFLADLESALCGPRRHRRRLIREIAAHLEDAVSAGIESGATAAVAAAAALDRFGAPHAIAERWNDDRRTFRTARRRRLALVALAVGGAGALGVTQYAAGKPRPVKAPTPAMKPAHLPEQQPWSERIDRERDGRFGPRAGTR